jgi:glycosyltransferase involved in cell wall biosynthesis
LLQALKENSGAVDLDVRVVGRRGARRHAQRLGARWVPARPGTIPRMAYRRADLVHLLGIDLPPPNKGPFVATVHDITPLLYADEMSPPQWFPEIVERASLLLTPSAFTAAELQKHLSIPAERICVFGGAPALEARDAEPLSADELHDLGIEPPFVLRYGGFTTRKNVSLLLEAWAHVSLGTLVLTGPPQAARARILDAAPSLDRVVVLDYVSKTLLARLLRSAAVLVSTSSYEGFGLPPLEALAAGTPVVAVSTPFTREVCGSAALLVEGRAEAVADALHQVLSDTDLAQRLTDAGPTHAADFTWSRAADAVQQAYARVLERDVEGG